MHRKRRVGDLIQIDSYKNKNLTNTYIVAVYTIILVLTLYIHVSKFTHISRMSKKSVPVIFIILGIFLAIWAWPLMPATMATHWGISGEVNGYSSKAVGLLIMPLISTIMFVAFTFLPKLEPYRKNFTEFESYFDSFMIIILI